MLSVDSNISAMINSPVRKIGARVELYNGSTLLQIFKYSDLLKSFSVDRVGEDSKFFGYGVCQKLNVKLVDIAREINITTENTIEVEFGVNEDYICTFPLFYVTEVHRDENTNEPSITAYDALYKAYDHTVSELGISSYTIKEFATACAALLGLQLKIDGVSDPVFDTLYSNGANFDGTETIREALNAVAEATQTIYYINRDLELTFKRLDLNGAAVATISKDKYISLESKTNRRLATICHATELGDNVSASTTETGSTQYVRDNPFWDFREDVGTLVDNALAAVGGLTINQYSCKWRGDFTLEIGDKIALVTKDNETVITYLTDDSISYNGFLIEQSAWIYTDNEEESASNPTNLGEILKQTYARVDKANKQIDLVSSESAANGSAIAALQLNMDAISASVRNIEQDLSDTVENVNGNIATLTQSVNAKMSAEDVQIQIQSELENGVDKVVTTTGFTFNDDGLTVRKSGSEMSTQITEDGMTVTRDYAEVLRADNEGVKAEDLHATTYLIIGNNSRFEDYGSNRTACFYIGG